MVRRFLAPRLFGASAGGSLTAKRVGGILKGVIACWTSKAAVHMAVQDAELAAREQSLAEHLGADRDHVPTGVAVGIQPSVPQLSDVVGDYLDQGYVRIKLKIMPGWAVEPARAVREHFGDDLVLQVDTNAAFNLVDAPLLGQLDAFGLLLIEQPPAEGDLRQHAVCLDESIVSAKIAADALAMGACRVINVKPGRVGGYLEAKRIHDLARADGIAVRGYAGHRVGPSREFGARRTGRIQPARRHLGIGSLLHHGHHRTVRAEYGHVAVSTGPGSGVTPIPGDPRTADAT